MTNRIEATSQWVRHQLGQSYTAFAGRWKDSRGSAWVSLLINGEPLGHLLPHIADELIVVLDANNMPYKLTNTGVDLLPTEQALERTFSELALAMRDRGLVPLWRDEKQSLYRQDGTWLVDIERGLFKTLGLQSRAVHLHAFSAIGNVWISRRAMTKSENPGMLDNLSAGGIGAGENHLICAERELWEEAGLKPEHLSTQTTSPYVLWVNRPLQHGWHNELIYMVTINLKAETIPANQDGEASGFFLMTPVACQKKINDWQFTPDAGLVTALQLTNPQPNRTF